MVGQLALLPVGILVGPEVHAENDPPLRFVAVQARVLGVGHLLGLRESAVGEVGRRRAARELVGRDADAAVLDHPDPVVGQLVALLLLPQLLKLRAAVAALLALVLAVGRLDRGGRQVLVEPVADPREHAAPEVAIAQRGDCRAIARRALQLQHAGGGADVEKRGIGRDRSPVGGLRALAGRGVALEVVVARHCAGQSSGPNLPTRGSRTAIFSASFAL